MLPPLANTGLPVVMDLPVLDILYKWNRLLGGLLCWAPFTHYSSP